MGQNAAPGVVVEVVANAPVVRRVAGEALPKVEVVLAVVGALGRLLEGTYDLHVKLVRVGTNESLAGDTKRFYILSFNRPSLIAPPTTSAE